MQQNRAIVFIFSFSIILCNDAESERNRRKEEGLGSIERQPSDREVSVLLFICCSRN